MIEQNEHQITQELSTFITDGVNGWQAGFTIGVQTFYLQPVGCEVGDERDTEERAKWYQKALETAFKNINAPSPSGANVLVAALEQIRDGAIPINEQQYVSWIATARQIAHSSLTQYNAPSPQTPIDREPEGKKECPYYNDAYANKCDKDDCSCDIFGEKEPEDLDGMGNDPL